MRKINNSGVSDLDKSKDISDLTRKLKNAERLARATQLKNQKLAKENSLLRDRVSRLEGRMNRLERANNQLDTHVQSIIRRIFR